MVKSCPDKPAPADDQQSDRQTLPAHRPLAIAVGEVEFGHGMIVSDKRSGNDEER